MGKPRRNPRPNKDQLPKPTRGDLSLGLITQLDTAFRQRRRTSSQKRVSQSAEHTQVPDTPSTITSFTPVTLGYPENTAIDKPRHPTAGNQPVSGPESNSWILDTTFQHSTFVEYHANGPPPQGSANMQPSNMDGYGYQPPHPTQSTSDVSFMTTDTDTYPSPLPAQPGTTQDQHDIDVYPLQAQDVHYASNQDTSWQQPLLPALPASDPPLTFKIRRQNGDWEYIEVYWDLEIGPSYLMPGAAEKAGWSRNEFTPFPPGNYDQAQTQDGLLVTPTHWVTVDMADDFFSPQPESVHISIYPWPQPFWTSARLIMGLDLWNRLYQSSAGGSSASAPEPLSFRS